MSSGRWIVQMCARMSVTVVIAAAAAASSFAEVIHDQRGMMASGTADGHVDAFISGAGTGWGEIRDQQACDDFVLDVPMRITRVTVDIVNHPTSPKPPLQPILPPAGGFLIEVFADLDGTPSETPTVAVTSLDFENLGTFTPPATNPHVDVEETATYQIDLAGVQLEPGVWWLSVVPVDETPFGQRYKWMGLQNPPMFTGSASWDRAGADDHGNGYGNVQTNRDWRSTLTRPVGLHQPRELSFTIEGVEIFSADIDGDGVVGSADLAAMLGQWGACGGEGVCPADLDGDGSVGSADLASLLGAWGTTG